MNKDMLKASFVVELRNSDKYMILPYADDTFSLCKEDVVISLNHFSDTLEYKEGNHDYDIIKVYGYSSAADIFSMSVRNRNLIWDRGREVPACEHITFEEICAKAVKKWGKEQQSIIVMEELAELIQAVSKYNRPQPISKLPEIRDHIAEEMADVTICLEQLKTIAEISENELQTWIYKKAARIEERMRKE